MNELPAVTIILPIRNEAGTIESCLRSILRQDYPVELLEVLILDGMSDDGTKDVVRALLDIEAPTKHGSPTFELLSNPGRIVPTGFNIGLRRARGEVIVRVDGHCVIAPDYVRQCVSLLRTTKASNVGGVQRAVGKTYVGKAIAVATTSAFGAGDAKFRYSEREQWVDSVFLGAWYKATLHAIGGFDEQWVVNQDYEANYRLRKSGGRIWLSPKIRCEYFVRDSLRALARQYFRYGMWRVKTLVAHPNSLRWRQLAAPSFVLALGASLPLLWVSWPLGVGIPMSFLAASLLAPLVDNRRGGSIRYLPVLPLVFLTLHVSWGLGFFAGLSRFGLPRVRLKTLVDALRRAE